MTDLKVMSIDTFLNLCTVAPNPMRAEPMSPACSVKAMSVARRQRQLQ